jgi:WD40 repeat protein
VLKQVFSILSFIGVMGVWALPDEPVRTQYVPITGENAVHLQRINSSLQEIFPNIYYDSTLELLVDWRLGIPLTIQYYTPDELSSFADIPDGAIKVAEILTPDKMILLLQIEETLQLWDMKENTRTTIADDVKDREVRIRVSDDSNLIIFRSYRVCEEECGCFDWCPEFDEQSYRVYIWDNARAQLNMLDLGEFAYLFEIDGSHNRIITRSEYSPTLEVWDSQTFTKLEEINPPNFDAYTSTTYSPETDSLIYGVKEGMVFYHLTNATSTVLKSVEDEFWEEWAMSSDGDKLAVVTAHDDFSSNKFERTYQLKLWKLHSDQWTQIDAIPIDGVDGMRDELLFSPDNRFVAIGTPHGQLLLFDIATSALTTINVRDDGEPVGHVGFTPDQKYLVVESGYGAGEFSVWGVPAQEDNTSG